jgi:hypothetical protein
MNKGLLVVIISAIVVGSGALTYVTYGSGRLVVDIADPPRDGGRRQASTSTTAR